MTDDNTITIDESELEQLVEQKVQERIDAAAAESGQSRRSVLSSLAGLAGIGAMGYFGGRRVAAGDPADASGTVFFEQIGNSNHPVQELHVENEVVTSTTSVTVEDADITNSLTDPSGTTHSGELADSSDVSSIQSSSDVDHDSTSGGTAGNPHANSASDNHDNTAHSEEFVSDGDGTTRQIWVIANGASDPAGADPEDIIFEEES